MVLFHFRLLNIHIQDLQNDSLIVFPINFTRVASVVNSVRNWIMHLSQAYILMNGDYTLNYYWFRSSLYEFDESVLLRDLLKILD